MKYLSFLLPFALIGCATTKDPMPHATYSFYANNLVGAQQCYDDKQLTDEQFHAYMTKTVRAAQTWEVDSQQMDHALNQQRKRTVNYNCFEWRMAAITAMKEEKQRNSTSNQQYQPQFCQALNTGYVTTVNCF